MAAGCIGSRMVPPAPPMPTLSPLVVDMTADSDEERAEAEAEVVDVVDESADEELERGRGCCRDLPPLRFRGYRRGRELGRGASGKVFVCSRKGCETSFAVKVVDLRRMQLSSNAERQQTSLRREVEILKSLPPHPNIVQWVDAFEESSWFLLVLELVCGGDLYTVLMSREPPQLMEREAAYVQRQLVDGLCHLHRQGVVHRDLKLENILVQAECREDPWVFYGVKITDFGLSKAIGAGSEARSLVGTRPYTAPEVLAGGSYDFSSDLWCLGVLLYVLLVGRFPFDATPAGQQEIDAGLDTGEAQAAEVAPDTGAADAPAPPVLSRLARSMLRGLLQLEPTERYSLEAIVMHEWLQDESIDRECSERATPAKRRPEAASPAASAPAFASAVGAGTSTTAPSQEESASLELGAPPSKRRSTSDASPSAAASPADGIASAAPAAASSADLGAAAAPACSQVAHPVAAGASASMTPKGSGAAHDFGDLPSREESPEPTPSPEPQPRGSSLWARPELTDVFPSARQPDVMQTHMVVPARLSEFLLGRRGSEGRKLAATVGCQLQVRVSCDDRLADHRVIIVGTCNQCCFVQELLLSRLAQARRAEGAGEAGAVEVLLFVRAEAAGVVLGKRGFVLRQIKRQSGASIELMREDVKGQRPCIVSGALQSVLRAERHVFDLVGAVPLAPPAPSRPWRQGDLAAPLPRARVQASARQGLIYLHGKDVSPVGAAPAPGQRLRFHVYVDARGLGAEDCCFL